jgi:hypothetical protein
MKQCVDGGRFPDAGGADAQVFRGARNAQQLQGFWVRLSPG